jgi:hypothetical protein
MSELYHSAEADNKEEETGTGEHKEGREYKVVVPGRATQEFSEEDDNTEEQAGPGGEDGALE